MSKPIREEMTNHGRTTLLTLVVE